MKKRIALGLLVATVIVGAAMIAPVVLAQQPSADLILTNGKIITVDDRFSIAQAIAVRGDRIIAVGTTADITKLAGPQTRRVDLRGKSVVPGFIDNHAHFQEEGAYWSLDTWRAHLEAAGFEELRHYYRPEGLPCEQQPWLAVVARKP